MAPQLQLAPFGMPCVTDPICRAPQRVAPAPQLAERKLCGVLAQLAEQRRES